MSSLEAVLRQLADVQTRLDDLPADAFVQRIELRDRINELRVEAGELRSGTDAEGATTELLARLANLRGQRVAVKRSRVDVVKQGALGFTPSLNRDIEKGMGLTGLDEQIAELEQILSDRGVDLD
jgi:hypothetical protein